MLSPDTISRWAEENHLYGRERRLLERLAEGPATLTELVDHLYADCEDGGPLNPKNCVYQFLYHLRKKLGHRIAIEKEKTYKMSIYPPNLD